MTKRAIVKLTALRVNVGPKWHNIFVKLPYGNDGKPKITDATLNMIRKRLNAGKMPMRRV